MKSHKIIYTITGRGFKRNSLGRKISEVIKSWEKDTYNVNVVCGGDINNLEITNDVKEYGSMDFHQKKYRKKKILSPCINSYSEFKDILHDRKLLAFLKNTYKNEDIDLVWERNSRLHRAGYLFAKEKNVPYVFEWMDNLIQYKYSLLRPYALWMEKFKEKNANYIIVVSEVLKDNLISRGVDADKILVLYNGVNCDEFKPSKELRTSYRNEIGVKQDDVIIGYLGSFAFYHDTERLVLAAKIIKDKGIKNIKILLVGKGKEYQQCYELAKELDLIGNILMFKDGVAKEKVPEVLAAIDISVLPGSTDIICPIKVFEYMAAETVSLIPDYTCNREVISDFQNGVLFKPKDEFDLAEKIMFLHNDAELCSKIGKNARKVVKEKYSWEQTWGKAPINILDNEASNYGFCKNKKRGI